MTLIHDVLGVEVTRLLNPVVLVMNLGCYAAWTFFSRDPDHDVAPKLGADRRAAARRAVE
jgi:hypothetical protein